MKSKTPKRRGANLAAELRALAAKINRRTAPVGEYAVADLLRELADASRAPWWEPAGEQVVHVALARVMLATSSARHDDEHIQLVNDACVNVDRILADAVSVDRGQVFGLRSGLRVKAHPHEGTVDDARRRLRALGESARRDETSKEKLKGRRPSNELPRIVLLCLEGMRPMVEVRNGHGQRQRVRVRRMETRMAGFRGLSLDEQSRIEVARLRDALEVRAGFTVADKFSDEQLAAALRAWSRSPGDRKRPTKFDIVDDVLANVFARKIDSKREWQRAKGEVGRGPSSTSTA